MSFEYLCICNNPGKVVETNSWNDLYFENPSIPTHLSQSQIMVFMTNSRYSAVYGKGRGLEKRYE